MASPVTNWISGSVRKGASLDHRLELVTNEEGPIVVDRVMAKMTSHGLSGIPSGCHVKL
jgi:hypothetical protein